MFFGNKIEKRLMQTEVVELLSYNAVKVLVEYGHNIPSKSESEEPDFKLRPLVCWDSQLLLVIGAPLFQFIPQCPHVSGRNA